jgi:hypothetical protein
LHASAGSESGKDQPPAEPSIGDAIIQGFAKEAEKRQKLKQAAAERAKSVPAGRFARFVDGCNAYYRDPANSGHRNATAWCECLSEQYLGVMTPEEESRYANDFKRLFLDQIAQPQRNSTDPAWPRLHPARDRCAQ